MHSSKVTVYISSFAASATKEDVSKFLQPFNPIHVRLSNKHSDSSRARKVAFADFADKATVISLIVAKDGLRFMGETMKVQVASSNRSNATSQQGSRFGTNRQGFPRQKPQREVIRGNFQILSMGSEGRLVALEKGWEADQTKLTEGIEEYSEYVKCGVEMISSDTIFACFHADTRKWRRCRMVRTCAPGEAIVEFIDQGRRERVTRAQVLQLSSLYNSWTVKAVDLNISGYTASHIPPELANALSAEFEGKTFEITYERERTTLLTRDLLLVSDVKFEGESVLADWLRKGILRKL